jgi:TolA-binding protein
MIVVAAQTTWAAEWPDLGAASPTAPGDGSRDAALVVGIEDYLSVDDVAGARAVADAWYRWLAESRGVPLSRLRRLTDRQAVDHKIRSELTAAAAEAQAGGTLWVVFVGHGAPSRDGRDGLLVGADADRSADGIEQRSVTRSELLAAVERSAGAPVVVLDACFSGQTGTGAALVPGLQPLVPSWAVAAGQRATVLSATSSGEFEGPLPGAGVPAFGYLALGALRGWGDANRDGSITASEVVEYAKGALRATVTDRTQTPSLLGPDAALAKGKERGPDLVSLALSASPAPAPVTPVVPGTDFAALAAKAKAAEAELRRVEAERQVALQQAAEALRARATADYAAIRDLVTTPTASGKGVLEAWLAQYGSATVTVAGVTQPVTVAEVSLVRAALAKVSAAPSFVPDVGAEPMPDTASGKLELAAKHMAEGRNPVARAILKAAIDQHVGAPEMDEIRYRYAETFFNEQDWKQAISRFNDVINNHPNSSWKCWSFFRQGEAFEALGKPDGAAAFYHGATEGFCGSTVAGRKAKEKL